MISGREEDRLLFDHQRTLAKMFGYEDDNAKMAVEQFMQYYYRWALSLGELNDVLMQLFDETILRACEAEEVYRINPRFQVRNGHIEVTNDKVFQRTLQEHRRCTRLHHSPDPGKPRPGRRDLPQRSQERTLFHGHPARAAKSRTAITAHAALWHSGEIPTRIRQDHRPDAARPVPYLHRGCAHHGSDQKYAPLPVRRGGQPVPSGSPGRQRSAQG